MSLVEMFIGLLLVAVAVIMSGFAHVLYVLVARSLPSACRGHFLTFNSIDYNLTLKLDHWVV